MKLLHLLAAVFFAAAMAPASAQTAATGYPNKPVKLIVPFPPGGAADNIGRAVAASLQSAWNQTVIVENRPGAGGMVGAEAAARATADPYTLFLGSIGVMTVNQHIHKDMRYDTVKDFTPISMLLTMPSVLIVNQSVPANNVQEFLRHARANPGKLSYGSAGNGTTEHTNGVMLASLENLDMLHVPYKGIAPALTDLLGGQINFIIEQAVAALPLIKVCKVKALDVTTAQRSPILPDVPTLAESGVKGFNAFAWYALYAPAGIAPAIRTQINADLVKHFNTPANKARFADIGGEVSTSTPEALAAFQATEIVRWADIVKRAGIRRD
ncbi:tripartite tricarboxylate transporter substrate binding protein [Lacisediminimonas sp.]|uniref:Bug family tripartite tricarboxylate transporter substrate binding protein n=1 Tax=Lacisediminimonas sp. TaxID=3060582 RepID=UPI00271F167F|nr:tripartite tricarboxylate transporter substrate binding protein [Lacisediminimonas sp.]MDO8300549.1 tripartite tricarboxylate transporter substrate binding protein [Lacisediminimonas sp.]